MDRSRSNERVRFRYGICLNEGCEQCKKKEVMEIPARKDFVCPECGKPLRECPAPRKRNNKIIILIAGIVALLALGAVLWLLLPGGDGETPSPRPVDSPKVDSVKVKTDSMKTGADKVQQERDSLQAVADSLSKLAEQQRTQTPVTAQPAPQPMPRPTTEATPATRPTPQPTPATNGSKNLGYATFKGTLRNGQPDDVNGRLIFNSSHIIDNRDPKRRVAEPGDYVIGEFSEGHLVQGIWYGADNQVKGSIIIGK